MKIDMSNISNVPKTIVSKCSQVGENAGNYIKQIPGKVDEFIKSESFTSIKGKVKEHNKTLIGGAIILAVGALAIKSALSIKKELEKIKNK